MELNVEEWKNLSEEEVDYRLSRDSVKVLQCVLPSIAPLTCTEEEGLKWEIKPTDSIDILIPCFNKESSIKKTVTSALLQKRKPSKIIILLMDTYSQLLKEELEGLSPLVECICHGRMNTSAARNYLASISKAEWVIFLDADDSLDFYFIEEVTKKPCAVCFPKMYYRDINNNLFDASYTGSMLCEEHPWNAIIQNFTCLIRREILKDIHFDESIWAGGEDTDFIVQLFKKRKYYMYHNRNTYYIYERRLTKEGLMVQSKLFYEHQKKMYYKNREWIANEVRKSWGITRRQNEQQLWLLENWTPENYKIYERTYCYIKTGIEKENQLITFTLNRKCNQKCSYCFQENMNAKDISDEEIYANFDKALTWAEKYTKGNLIPQIMGGEPTIWSEELQRKIINRVRDYRTVYLFTNGTRLKESLFWKQFNFFYLVHEYDWFDKTALELYSKYNRGNVSINLVIRTGELNKVKEFIERSKNGEGNSKYLSYIFFSPCDRQRGKCSEGMKDAELIQLSDLLKDSRYDTSVMGGQGLKNKSFRRTCQNSPGIWNIDCIEMTIAPCCGENHRWKLDEFNEKEIVRDCEDCVSFGNLMPLGRIICSH